MTSSRRRRGRGLALFAILLIGAGVAWGVFGRDGGADANIAETDRLGGDDDAMASMRSDSSSGEDASRDSGRGSTVDSRRNTGSDSASASLRDGSVPVLELGGGSAPNNRVATGSAAQRPNRNSSGTSTDAPRPPSGRTTDGRRDNGEPAAQPTVPPEAERWTGPGSGVLDGQPLPSAGERASGDSAAPARGRGQASDDRTSGPLQSALRLVRSDPVEARRRLTAIAVDHGAPAAERARAREALNDVNATILFAPLVLPDDPFVSTYTVQAGDTLQRINRRNDLDADWRLLMRINNIADERRVRIGQTLKLVSGVFHAVVSKAEYRMDVFLGESEDRVLVASFPVGLGEYNSTPTGRFRVRENSKLINPAWVNPRTGERFAADDPKNPIGDRWIGLEGIDPANANVEGYGIHGTIEPDSIGRQASMGCVRMLADDVALVYELLTHPKSTVLIVD